MSHLFPEGVFMREVRSLSDEYGLYLLEVRSVPEGDADDAMELTYMRKGSFPEGSSTKTRIDVVYYNVEGVPTGGRALKTFENNQWIDA
jgi:hypothetical protein